MEQFDAEVDAIENGVICVLGILLYIAIIHQRWRHLKTKPSGEKWYCHISLVLLSIFVIGSILCSSWFGIACSRDSPARVPSVIWKAIMVLCLIVSKLHVFNQALRPQTLIAYYACILILPVVWVGVSVWQKRYAALWAFSGWIYLTCAAAFFMQSIRTCKQPWSRRCCLMLGLMNALAGTLTAALGIFSVLNVTVTPPFYFHEQCFILLLELALTVVYAEKQLRAAKAEGIKLQEQIRQGVHNQAKVRQPNELSGTDLPSLPARERYEIVSDFTETGFANIISRDIKLSACISRETLRTESSLSIGGAPI
ncbi:uncharacterized protein BBA_10216 [Beauveria bassiana ARSEF 2860]|uniref:Uncharacterized protein n=1 Tax=Beauveria bassiana (strain ARSEF 2860) TaxID=655819 RepID=J5J9T0_BEAB2|nr:uncharacterized protein BBA_10216 [Beauveria bassiana ARSEF 2860]EJP60831.1 hypothetical protein BBA_10216 [Beauveria bassiana ARSEF 2860]